ncbi:hypothetical protein GCM10009837_17240 [Streptomyces durmitorensis]|uniref:Methyl-accepting chemotaxis protein n=1 Tax=Streptomyces durmitorensis TaxID=319947 RepID=A0ABY4PQ99_9ACTN|nr:hypothetical protein [Streptomyces durmitorensis]UQT55580.1 hypothetical protein M4V62_11015 [Streptomyces durmitorensis]
MTPAELLDKQKLVDELQRLAAHPSLAPRSAELAVLAQDLKPAHQLDRWAEVDLVDAYVRPESVVTPPVGQAGRHDGRLEAALGILVFIPLLVTWFGLREAVRAYGELSKEDPKESTRPFLQLWQSGFGGHLSALGRFENVALMAVLLIALLVLLSVWHARVRARTEREEVEQQSERERLLAELASVLTRTQMVLAPHRSASPQQFTSELTKAATQMQLLASKAETSHKALTGTTTAVSRSIDALKAAADALTVEVPKLGVAASRIEQTLRDGRTAADKASVAGTDAARGIADRVKAAGDTVEASLKSLIAAQQSLVTKSESVAAATDRASQALVASTGRTGDAVEGMREATERWDAAAAHWQDAAARLDARIGALVGASGLPGSATVPASASLGTRTVPASAGADGNGHAWGGSNGDPAGGHGDPTGGHGYPANGHGGGDGRTAADPRNTDGPDGPDDDLRSEATRVLPARGRHIPSPAGPVDAPPQPRHQPPGGSDA